jgi:phage terminase large subunit-like protein
VIHSWYSYIRADGKRRTRIAPLTLGRKQGKTALLAGLCLFHLVADGVQSPSVVSCACDREQAAQIYKFMEYSIEHWPTQARKKMHLRPSFKEIEYLPAHGKYKSLSTDAKGRGKYGHGHTFICHDEGSMQKDDSLWVGLKNATDASGGMQVLISSAGFNKNGYFYRMIEDSRKILNGSVIDTSIQPWIFEVPSGADYEDETNWKLSCPSLGSQFASVEDFRQGWTTAKRDNAEKANWIRLKYNNWTDAQTTWIDPAKFELCRNTNFPDLTNAPCHVGIDAGHLTSATTIAAVFPVDQKYYVKCWALTPESATHKNKLIPYDRFRLDNSLTIIPGNVVDQIKDIYPIVDHILNSHNVISLTYDQWQLRSLGQYYQNQGINTFEFTPSCSKANEATIALERAIENQLLQVEPNEFLRWQIGHAILKRDNRGYVMVDKPSPQMLIDTLDALVMCFDQLITPANEALEVDNPFEWL